MSYSDRPLPEMVVCRLLEDRASSTPDRPFLRFGDEVWTYAEVHQAALEYSTALAAVGVKRGDLVAIMMKNSPLYVIVYFALAYRGAAVVLVNTAFRGYLLEYVLNDARCALLVADADLLGQVADSEPALEHLDRVMVTHPEPGWVSPFDTLAAAPLARPAPGDATDETREPAEHDDLHCVVYSSGTTGPSKGIMISNAHAVAKACEVIEICAFTADDVLYSPLPLFYSMGLLRGVLSVAITGGSIVLRDKFSVSAYWDEVRRTGATVGHTVFSLPAMLMSQPPDPRDREHRLRCMFNARHDPAFEERFGVRLIEGYGLTEAGNAIFSRLAEPPVPGSCGRVSDEWEVRLADDHGDEVSVGQTGELLLRPRHPHRIMLGYLNKPEVTTAAWRDLWFHTGDLARRDEAGNYFYVGRTKEMIRRRGQNISSWELETIVSTFPAVGDVAALPHPSEIGDDDVRVVVSAARPGALDLDELRDFCQRRLPAFMVPRYLELRDELPKTPSGRIEKYKLLQEPMSENTLDSERSPSR